MSENSPETVALGEVYWDTYVASGDGPEDVEPIRFAALPPGVRRSVEAGAQAVADVAIRRRIDELDAQAAPVSPHLGCTACALLGTGHAPARVTAVLDVNGTIGLVSVPGDSWTSPIIPGHLIVTLNGQETARFTAGRWLGVSAADPEADAGLAALLGDGGGDESLSKRDEMLAAIDKFESDLGFTAPELIATRIEQLRGMVRGIFEEDCDEDGDPDDWDDNAKANL